MVRHATSVTRPRSLRPSLAAPLARGWTVTAYMAVSRGMTSLVDIELTSSEEVR